MTNTTIHPVSTPAPRQVRFVRAAPLLASLAVAALTLTACSSGPAATPVSTPARVSCAPVIGQVKTPGTLTVSTTNPAYEPYFEGDPNDQFAIEPVGGSGWKVTDPYSMHGFESGVAYSLGNAMGFEPDHVLWVPHTLDEAVAPGQKDFDFYIGRVRAGSDLASNVSVSDPYLESSQALLAIAGSAIQSVKSIADLKSYKLGAVAGTPGAELLRDVVQPSTPPVETPDQPAAVDALSQSTIDGFVTDIATAFLLIEGADRAPVLPTGVVVGKFAPAVWTDEYVVVLQKDSPLVGCVNDAIAEITRDGSLQEYREEDIPAGTEVELLQ
jgi:polar amino acid transport system substrate-binding protein